MALFTLSWQRAKPTGAVHPARHSLLSWRFLARKTPHFHAEFSDSPRLLFSGAFSRRIFCGSRPSCFLRRFSRQISRIGGPLCAFYGAFHLKFSGLAAALFSGAFHPIFRCRGRAIAERLFAIR
jgi:hypothetical protein